MGVAIPDSIAATIKKAWPRGVVEPFDESESYFERIYPKLEDDLMSVPGVAMRWQTEDDEGEWQSYHVFFLAPAGDAFCFQDATEAYSGEEEVDDEEPELTTVRGEGWIGLAIAVSKVTRIGLLRITTYSRFDDGAAIWPDIGPTYSETGEIVADEEAGYRTELGDKAFWKLEQLRGRVNEVLAKYRIEPLQKSIAELPVTWLRPSKEAFLEQPIRVRDAFFFRGV